MAKKKLKDAEAKAILLKWPSSTSSVWPSPQGDGRWIQAQPVAGKAKSPRISSPGAKLFNTQPDGLYVYFNGESSCDLVVIEVCGSIQNLNDKRSRYYPSSHSIVLNCSRNWLCEPVQVQGGGRKARWDVAKSVELEPKTDWALPVRHLRVLYSLPNELYSAWCPDHVPTGYEFFCPHSSLDSYNSQKMQGFLARMSIATQFYEKR